MTTTTYTPVDLNAYVLITRDLYDQLMDESRLLARLEAAGVDNWEGYPGVLVEDDDPYA